MNRRHFITAAGTASTFALAGCTNSPDNNSSDNPSDDPSDNSSDDSQPSDPPADLRGAYIGPHTEEMEMIGMDSNGRLTVALSYSLPHEFTLITGTRSQLVDVAPNDSMHLMVSVWDNDTLLTPPQAEPSVTIYRDDQELTTVNPWPMLAQQMGYHFGDNVKVRGEGEYRFEIDVNTDTSAMPTDLQNAFTGDTFTFTSVFNPIDARDLEETPLENSGDPGAISPMRMGMMPVPQQPNYQDIPLDLTDTQYSNDAGFAVGTHDSPETFGSDEDQYLVVATQTRYNRYLLPLMSLSARVERNGDVLYDDTLKSSLHPDIGHFYGAGVPALDPGDTVTLTVNVPPQTSRHEGYDEAFLQIEQLEFTL